MTYQEEYGYFEAAGKFRECGRQERHSAQCAARLHEPLSGIEDRRRGVDFKLGVIVRPVAGLRVGVAFHTPTYYWLDRSYRADIESHLINNKTEDDQYNFDSTPRQDDIGGNSWDFGVAFAAVGSGASYTFGNFAIVSVDYEREWYNGIRVKNVPEGADFHPEAYKAEFKNNYKGTNTLRQASKCVPCRSLPCAWAAVIPIRCSRTGSSITIRRASTRATTLRRPRDQASGVIRCWTWPTRT